MEWTAGWSCVSGELYDQAEAFRRQSETKWASSASLPGWESRLCRACNSGGIYAAWLQIRPPLLSFYSQKNTQVIARGLVMLKNQINKTLLDNLLCLSSKYALVYSEGHSCSFFSV